MTVSQSKAIHLGAGNIGRGFIRPLLVEFGYHVVFADVDDIIQELNERDSNISGLVSTSDDVIQAFVDPAADLVTTAVGPTILERIATAIAKGIHTRRAAHGPPLNIIACENIIHPPDDAPARTHKAWADVLVGFANCSVDRITPPYKPSGRDSPLNVGVEGFYGWVVDGSARHVDHKLFTLNCGHAINAYLCFLKRHTTIDAAVHDEEIYDVVYAALRDEVGAALMGRHQFDEAEYGQYVDKIMERFADPRLKDDVVRVEWEPLRKLSRGDRLLGPTSMALEFGLPTDNLSMGIAAAFLYDVPEEQRVDLQHRIKQEGISKVVVDVTGFEEGGEEHRKIIDAYREFRLKYTPPN